MATEITCKTVRRWYFKGKGYASRKRAYRAKAKRLLFELVFGPRVEAWHGGATWFQLMNESPPPGVDWKDHIDARFALFFPHDNSDTAIQPGCMHDPSAHACRRVYADYNVFNDREGEWDFKFKSCKHSQQLWLDRKVAELMEADAEVQR